MAIAKYSKVCSANTPGISKFWVTEVANITACTIASNEVTALTNSTKFKPFQADADTIQFTQEGSGKQSYAETFKLVAKFSKKTKALITAKQSLVDGIICGLAVIRQDANGQCFLSGYNAVDLGARPYNKISVNFDSGAAPTDEGMNAYTITLEGTGGQDEVAFDATLTAGIVGGTSAFVDWT